MNIYNMNMVKLKEELLLCINSKEKFNPSLIITNPTTFLTQSLVVFSNVKLIRDSNGLISFTDTFASLPSKISTPNGYMTSDNLKALVVILYHTPRSFFVRKMTSDSSLASFTPLFMYAHKLYNNIPYEDWDKEDPKIFWALGKFLEEAIGKAPKERIDIAGFADGYRKTALTYLSGKKQGQTEHLLAYKMPQKLKVSDCTTNEEYIVYRQTLYMLLQTWLCNVEVRNDAMILDPWDWDLTPEPIDSVIPKEAISDFRDLI